MIFLTDPSIDRDRITRTKGDRTPGTCYWITQNAEYQLWLTGDSGLLWIRGGPGKGKTMMSIFLSEDLAADNLKNVIFYFCAGQDDKRNTATAVLRGLLWQMTGHEPDLMQYLAPFFDPPGRGHATLASEETLWQLLKDICNRSSKRTYCVIDGIDECDEDSAHWLAARLASIESDSAVCGLNIVVLSRHLIGLDGRNCISLDSDHDGQVSADVQMFVRDQMRRVSRQVRLNVEFREHVVTTLLDRSEGTFLWVGFVMNELSKKKTGSKIAEAIHHLPQGLPAFYARMLHEIEPEDRENSKRLLIWVAMNFKPTPLDALADILNYQVTMGISGRDAARDAVESCAPMLVVQNDVVGFVHQSARDFLLRWQVDRDPVLEEFRINPEAAYLFLARQCLKALARDSELQYYALSNWSKHAGRLDKLAPDLFNGANIFFGQASRTRNIWWEKHSYSFRRLPNSEPPRLHIACYLGLEIWARMIMEDAVHSGRSLLNCITEQCPHGWTPLEYAVEGGSDDLVKLLLENEAEADILSTDRGEALLSRAIMAGKETTARLLISHGIDPRRLVQDALNTRNATSVRSLLSSNLGVDFSTHDLNVWLRSAIITKHIEMIKLLLKRGANANTLDASGDSLLCGAIMAENKKLTQTLLDNGADPNLVNGVGTTPLQLAAHSKNASIVQSLLDSGADRKLTGTSGETAAIIAARHRHGKILHLLLEDLRATPPLLRNEAPLYRAISSAELATIADILGDSSSSDLEIDNRRESAPAATSTAKSCSTRVKSASRIQRALVRAARSSPSQKRPLPKFKTYAVRPSSSASSIQSAISYRSRRSFRSLAGDTDIPRPGVRATSYRSRGSSRDSCHSLAGDTDIPRPSVRANFTIGNSSSSEGDGTDQNRRAYRYLRRKSIMDKLIASRNTHQHSLSFVSDERATECETTSEDPSDWDRSSSDGDPALVNKRTTQFERMDPQAILARVRSMLTTLVHEPGRANTTTNEAPLHSDSKPSSSGKRV